MLAFLASQALLVEWASQVRRFRCGGHESGLHDLSILGIRGDKGPSGIPGENGLPGLPGAKG